MGMQEVCHESAILYALHKAIMQISHSAYSPDEMVLWNLCYSARISTQQHKQTWKFSLIISFFQPELQSSAMW